MPTPQLPTPQRIIQAFATAAENISLGLDKPVAFALGERYQISPNGDQAYPLAFLELTLRMEPNSTNSDTWYVSFLLLQNHADDETQDFYPPALGTTYTLAMALTNELRQLLKPEQLQLLDMLSVQDDFDDNCTGWRVELKIQTGTDRQQC